MKITIAAISVILIWGFSFPITKIALLDFSPVGLSAIRLVMVGLTTGIYAIIIRLPRPNKNDLIRLLAVGILGHCGYNFFVNSGINYVKAGEASFIIALSPVIIAIIGYYFFHEKISWKSLCGILTAIVGVALITLDGNDLQANIGGLLCLAAAFCFSLLTILQKPLIKKHSIKPTMIYMMIGSGLGGLPLLPFYAHELTSISTTGVFALLYMIFLGTISAFVLWGFVVSNLPYSQAASLVYFVPFVASLAELLLLGEIMDTRSWLGGILIIIGVSVVNLRYIAKIKNKSP